MSLGGRQRMKNLIVTASMIVCSFICIPRAEASGVAAQMITRRAGVDIDRIDSVLPMDHRNERVEVLVVGGGGAGRVAKLFDQDLGTTTRVTLGLPTDGCPVYVRLSRSSMTFRNITIMRIPRRAPAGARQIQQRR